MSERIGDRIKQLRIERGLTQKEMSDKLGVSPSTIGMYEQNRREPDANTIVRLSELFNVSTDYLLDRAEGSLDFQAERPMTKIRELRISREISQKEFAEIIGVPANTLCQWETGKRAPDYEMLKKISAYFGVSVDYLLDNDKKEKPAAYDEVRSNPPYFKKSTPWLPALSDPQDREFLELYSELTPEERQFVLAAIKGMLSK